MAQMYIYLSFNCWRDKFLPLLKRKIVKNDTDVLLPNEHIGFICD